MTAATRGEELREAVALWEQAGRPLNAVRTRLLLARLLRGPASPRRRRGAGGGLAEAERLGVPHLAAAAGAELARG